MKKRGTAPEMSVSIPPLAIKIKVLTLNYQQLKTKTMKIKRIDLEKIYRENSNKEAEQVSQHECIKFHIQQSQRLLCVFVCARTRSRQ